jgi:hypothetical protein
MNEIAAGKRKERKIGLREGDYLTEMVDALNKILKKLP